MAVVIKFKQWEYLSKGTDNLKITTKMTDMDNPAYDKVLLGYFFNISQNTENSITTPAQFILNLKYRTNSGESFKLLNSTSNILGLSNVSTIRDIEKQVLFQTKIPFKNIQLQIYCPKIRGNFSINDFGIMYRELRSITVDKNE